MQIGDSPVNGEAKCDGCAVDMLGIVGAILMDLSKAYDCIPHAKLGDCIPYATLLIAKLEAYGCKKNALELVESYVGTSVYNVSSYKRQTQRTSTRHYKQTFRHIWGCRTLL